MKTIVALSLLLACACACACPACSRADAHARVGAAPGDASAPLNASAPLVAASASGTASPEDTWGIKAVSLRPTLNGTGLDFRYTVLDPEKARPLFDRKIKPYLFDPSSGVALGMPEDTKLGALRTSLRNPPVAGKHYYILFSNAYRTVKRGSRVTVVIGDCKFENVVVE